MMIRTFRAVSTAAAVSLALIGCTSGPSGELGSALQHQRERSEGTAYERPWTSVDELMRFIDLNHDREGFGGMRVVQGEFVEVQRGVGMNWIESADADEMVVLPYGSPEAVVETVHLDFRVDRDLSPHVDESSSLLTIGLAFDAGFDFDAIVRDYLSLDNVVLFVEQSPVFDYRPGTYGIINDGQLLGIVTESGSIEFPLVQLSSFAPADLSLESLLASR